MSPELKAFYEYHSSLMEPWDGPASIAFTDGTVIGAVLDRNGLRPSRYYVTKDDLVVMASEVGVLDIPPEDIVLKERLHPGRIFLVDTARGRIVSDEEIKRELAAAQPYKRLAGAPDRHRGSRSGAVPAAAEPRDGARGASSCSATRTRTCGCCSAPMATSGEEPLGSMGTDTSLAALSDRPRLLYDYFKQVFAQVTNPPLDAIREELVTSMESTIGPEGNLLDPRPESCRQIKIKYPVIDNDQLAKLRHVYEPGFRAIALPMLFDVRAGRPRPRARARGPEASARATRSKPATRSSSCRTATPIATARRSRACWRPPACTITWCARARARAARWSSNRATRAKCTTARCCSATAPARSTRTSRSRRSTT